MKSVQEIIEEGRSRKNIVYKITGSSNVCGNKDIMSSTNKAVLATNDEKDDSLQKNEGDDGQKNGK